MGLGNGELTALRKATYLGSHPRATGQLEGIDIIFRTDGIVLRRKREDLGFIAWTTVTELAAETESGMKQRVTGARVLLLGKWALLAQKNTVISYLCVTDAAGPWLFAIPGLAPIELRAGLTPLQQYVPQRTPAAPTTPPAITATPAAALPPADPAARLEQLAQLHVKGLISDDEFQQRRTAILDSL